MQGGRGHHHHHQSETVPPLFTGTADAAVSGLWRTHISVELSHEIPYPYVIDGSTLTLDRSMSAGLTRYFPTTELSYDDAMRPQTACSILRSIHVLPLMRVCGTIPARRAEHFQPYVLFTNYTRYVDEFVSWAAARSSIFTAPIALSCAGGGSGSPPKPTLESVILI